MRRHPRRAQVYLRISPCLLQAKLAQRKSNPNRHNVQFLGHSAYPSKDRMLRKPRSTSLFLFCRSIYQQHAQSLRELRTKSTNGYAHKNDNDDYQNHKIRNLNANQEDKIFFHKSKGQHILTNQRILDSIVRRSNINANDTVLEIGPGTGNLTLKLLEVSKQVFAIEIDKRMVDVLNRRVAERGFQDRLTVIYKDALKVDFPQFDLVVANIPYGISSPLVAKLVYGNRPFRSATLLLQKEFARRLLANPGDSEFNRLAANVKLVADVEFVMDVSKRDFLPCPKVDSSVVIIKPKDGMPDVNLDEWLAFTKTCFSKKNKTLGATFKQKKKVIELLGLSKKMSTNIENISNSYDCSEEDDDNDEGGSEVQYCYSSSCSEMEISSFKERIIEVLKSGGFEDKRPSKMSNEELLRLLSFFNQARIFFHAQTEWKNASNVAFAAVYNS